MTHKAILIDIVHFSVPRHEAEARLRELEDLTRTYGGVVVVKAVQRRAKPDYRTYVGSGKVQEILEEGKRLGATLLIVNDILKPQH
ncbi:MAG: hypothetical protein NUV56_01330, partial [Candidatus Uhrbacteria bacterium]|nr:hypothetical protein [Candidatus Uhrbacteria bacterium]